MIKYKSNILDACILIFTAILCYIYARKQLQIQELMVMEQKAKIELLTKVNISKYSLTEVQAIVDQLRMPAPPPPDKINIPWGTTYLIVPLDTDVLELRKLTEMYPGLRVVLMKEGENETFAKMFIERTRTRF